MLENLAYLNEKVYELSCACSKVYIYEFNDSTRDLLYCLAAYGIYVHGFIVDEESSKNDIKSFLNKDICSLSGISDSDLIIDLYGFNIPFLVTQCNCQIVTAVLRHKVEGNVYIYGAGEWGKEAYEFLTQTHIKVSGFFDNDLRKQGSTWRGVEIYRYSGERVDQKKTIIIAINNPDVVKKVCQQFAPEDIVYLYNGTNLIELSRLSTIFGKGFNITPYRSENVLSIYPGDINGLIYHQSNGKKIILFGAPNDLCVLWRFYKHFNINISYVVPCLDNNNYKIEHDIIYKDKWELLYEEPNKIIVLIVGDSLEYARKFATESGIDSNIFAIKSWFSENLWCNLIIDAHLGYSFAFKKSTKEEIAVVTLQTACKERAQFSLAVLGSSPSDATCGQGENWPEQLIKLAEKDKFNLKIYDAATRGTIIWQELIRFLRDILPLQPDMVISLSGVSEHFATRNRFTHVCQEGLFQNIIKNYHGKSYKGSFSGEKVYFGNDESVDTGEHWFMYERAMYAICKENNIKFYAVLYPSFYERKNRHPNEKEIELCWNRESIPNMNGIRERAQIKEYFKQVKPDNDWLIDYSEIFDDCDGVQIYRDMSHATEYGNGIIAANILELIKNECKK